MTWIPLDRAGRRFKCHGCGRVVEAAGQLPDCDCAPTRPSRFCVHFVAEELRRAPCHKCLGHVDLKVYVCNVHGECTLARSVNGVACCRTCPDYAGASVAASATGDGGTTGD